jgi:hypothetical protein
MAPVERIRVDRDKYIKARIWDIEHGKGYTRGWIYWELQRWVVVNSRKGWTVERRYRCTVEYHRWLKRLFGWPKAN